jgi:hypothetical protein
MAPAREGRLAMRHPPRGGAAGPGERIPEPPTAALAGASDHLAALAVLIAIFAAEIAWLAGNG